MHGRNISKIQYLSHVHKIENPNHFFVFDSFQVEQGVCVRVLLKDVPEERRARAEYELVGLDLAVLACEGHVEKLFVTANGLDGLSETAAKLIPLEVERVGCAHFDVMRKSWNCVEMLEFPIKQLFSVKTNLGRASDTGTGALDNDLTAAAGNNPANQRRVFQLWTNEKLSLSG